MFTRHVIMRLKADSTGEFARVAGGEVVPLLRRQKGFRHESTFITPGRSEAVVNSYWDTKECAEAYHRAGYPEVLKALAKVVEGTPEVQTFEISKPTFHRITAKRREANRSSNF